MPPAANIARPSDTIGALGALVAYLSAKEKFVRHVLRMRETFGYVSLTESTGISVLFYVEGMMVSRR